MLYNILKIAYQALLRNKMRALLTMLGIVIGISSVIAMVSIGQSSTYSILEEVSSVGSNMITIRPNWQMSGGVNQGYTASRSLQFEDIEQIRKKSKYVRHLSPYFSNSGQLVNGSNNYPATLTGVNREYFNIVNFDLKEGTFFSEEDVLNSEKVCVIGNEVKKALFKEDESPLGKTIRFNNIPLKVIGVLHVKGSSNFGENDDEIVLLPYTTIQNRMLSIDHLQTIFASSTNEKTTALAKEEIREILRESHRLLSYMEDDFRIFSQSDMLDMVGNVTNMLTILLAAIASISLVVGGIGIMNIMYVTVTERTREIGLRMALGAKNKNILFQFLAESVMLCFVGGIIGIIFGVLIAYGATAALNWPFVFDINSIILSFVVCGSVGIFFGWYPAKKAANLDPITALRYE